MLTNPVPGTTRKNNGGYPADSGLDILVPIGTPCVAAADGILEYAEHGHTPWMEDTNLAIPGVQYPYSIRIRLDKPIVWNGTTYRWIWYTHMTELAAGIGKSDDGQDGQHIRAGTHLGKSGIGNRVAHLHFGIIGDRGQTITMPYTEVAVLIWDGVDLGGSGTSGGGVPAPGASGPGVAAGGNIMLSVHDQVAGLQINGVAYDVIEASWESRVVADSEGAWTFEVLYKPKVDAADAHLPPPGLVKFFQHDGKATIVVGGQPYPIQTLTETAHVVPGKPAGLSVAIAYGS